MSSGKIAYVLKGFPRLSETFIANEVRLLTQTGLSLDLFSIKPGDAMAADHDLPAVHYLPEVTTLSRTSLRDWMRCNYPAFSDNQKYWLRRHPGRYIRTLVFALRCAFRYRQKAASWIKKSFIKEFLLATYIANEMDRDKSYVHIHAHFCHDATTVAWMVSKLTGLPFSFTAHAKDIYQKRLNPGDLLQRKLSATRFAVTCTNANVEYLRERSSSPENIHGVYHGLNTHQFVPKNELARSRNDLDETPKKLLAVGRMVEKKGFIYLIEACRILRDRGVSFKLELVGEAGDQSDRIRDAIAEYGLGNHIELQAPVPQSALLNYYRSAAIFVLPCIVLDDGDRDGIPNVMAEAMACALPVVVTGISGIPELVENDVNGVLVPTRDARPLADAIERLLQNPATRMRLGEAARHRIEAVFDANATHHRLKSIFDHALANAT